MDCAFTIGDGCRMLVVDTDGLNSGTLTNDEGINSGMDDGSLTCAGVDFGIIADDGGDMTLENDEGAAVLLLKPGGFPFVILDTLDGRPDDEYSTDEL